MSQENVEIVQRSYEALNRGDIDAWLKEIHVDIELHEIAEIPDATVYRGHDGLRRWADAGMQVLERWHWHPEELLFENHDSVLVQARLTGQGSGSGTPVEQVVFHLFEFSSDQVIRVRGFLEREQALEAAGLQE